MVFSSATFLFVFLPVTLAIYFLPLFRNDKTKEIKKKNLILCVASLIFYAWGEPVYVLLMLISIFFNFSVGIDLDMNRLNKGKRKAVFVFAVIFNLFILGFFKYSGFVIENINNIFSTNIVFKELSLPVGISFYTFQILSYIIDVYRGKVSTQKNIVSFAAYITMFPQLIAGPIVQYSDIEKQLSERTITVEKFSAGILFFIRGLGKKLIFANTVGAVYTQVMEQSTTSISVITAWLGIICYTLQIYFDFSGYSDMAIGLGKLFGFDFIQNFNYPYSAKSITDFWRRWHISLSSWFRDYVYIPLGGNRKGTFRAIINIAIVWSLTGLWHGAAWNFIAWGFFYGILLIVEKYVLKDAIEKIPAALRHVLTMLIVVIGWVFFSSDSLTAALNYIGLMFGVKATGFFDSTALYLLRSNGFSIAVMGLSAFGVFASMPKLKNKKANIIFQVVGYLLVFAACIAYLISETYNPFLYFRF